MIQPNQKINISEGSKCSFLKKFGVLWPSFWDSLFTFLPKKYPVETSALVGDYILNDFLKERNEIKNFQESMRMIVLIWKKLLDVVTLHIVTNNSTKIKDRNVESNLSPSKT